MPIGYIFWGLMIIWFVFGAVSWQNPTLLGGGVNLLGNTLLLFLLIAMLGWQVFGAAIK